MHMRKILLGFAMLFMVALANAQTVVVTSRVTDANGAPVPSATILEKGTRNGTFTLENGSFSIKVKQGAKLVVSAIGFESTEVSSDGLKGITLVADTRTLGEVVVTGVGTATSKKKLGIAVESIKSDKLPVVPAATLDQALIGKIPGAQISTISGNPGDQVNIVLRGINTVQGGTRPLVLLDGVEIPFSNLNTLDLSQVDRVEVVQGAASASLYGAQGANGVIQVFSKKGLKGKVSINASSSIAGNSYINSGDFGKASLHPYLTDASGNIVAAGSNASLGYNAGDPLKVNPDLGIILGSNSIAYRYGSEISNADLPNPSTIPGVTQSYSRYGILDPRNQANQPYKGNLHFYDHFKQVLQTGQSINNSLSINGGGDKMDYNLSMSNNRTTSALLKDNGHLDRTNFMANLGFEVFKNFTIRSVTNLVYTENNLHPGLGAPGGTGFGLGNSNAGVGGVYGFLNTSPFYSLTDTINGGVYPAYQSASFLSINAFNPFYTKAYTKGDSKRYDILQNFEANYKINRFVTLNAKYGISYKTENDIWTYYNQSLNANSNYKESWASAYNGTDNSGEMEHYQYTNTRQNFFASAFVFTDFEKDFNIRLPIQTTTQLSYDYRKNDYKEFDVWGQSLPLNPPFNFNSTQSQHIIWDFIQPFVTYGYLLDQKIDFGSYGGVTGGFRTDYSSAFGAGSKPFTFPHFNGYINLQSFSFWNGLINAIPAFKLRAAYGKAGIQPSPFDRYPVLNQQAMGNELTYTNQTAARNPNLNVEVSAETEVGTDFSIGLGRGNWLKSLNVSFSYWARHTDNAIFVQNVPPSTGATQLLTNAIELSSKGYQFGINIPVLASKTFTWDVTVNIGHQSSVIDNVTGGDIPLTSGAGSTGLILTAGRKIGEIYGYKALTNIGQVRSDGKTPFIATADQGNYEIVNGRVVNKITKSIYFSDEATSFGDPNPTLTSSFISNLSWKGIINFGFQFDWIMGAHLYNQTNEWMYRDGISSDFTKPVTINGQTGAWTAYYASAYYALGNTAKGVGNNVTKDYFYYDASFVRLRNISVGVDFSKFARANWLKKCQLVLSGRNLLTFTKYPGLDPEISSGSSNSAFDRGVDHSTIPNLKTVQASLNLAF